MAKKSSTKKSLKSLFSKSEANLNAPAENNEVEKKKFKLFKFKTKSKSGSAPEKPANESPQARSAVEPNNSAADIEALTASIVSKEKSSIYATAPRSKDKDFSYSEQDLSKPKRFATFSLGLKKKKKKYDDSISKSTFGLHSPETEDAVSSSTTPSELSQMELDQAKRMLSVSQPELDTSGTFDIPSPPPVGSNIFESNFTTLQKMQPAVSINAQPEAEEPLKHIIANPEEPMELKKAPIATIPELQLGTLDSSENNDFISAHESLPKSSLSSLDTVTHTETTSVTDNQTTPSVPASPPPALPATSDHKDADSDPVFMTTVPRDNILQDSHTNTEPSLAESGGVDTGDSLVGNHPTTSVESTIITEPTPLNDTDKSVFIADSAPVPEEISSSGRSVSETPTSVATSALSQKKSPHPFNEAEVYGALYDSLFPQSFISDALSSLTTSPPQIPSEIGYPKTIVRTLDEHWTETNTPTSSHLSTDFDATGRYNSRMSSPESSRFTSYQTVSESRRDTDILHTNISPSHDSSSTPVDGRGYSETTSDLSEGKSDRFALIQDTVKSSPVVQISTPPVSDYGTFQDRDTQVTASMRRVILVRESVTDEVSTRAASPVPDKMNTAALKTETSGHSGAMDAVDAFVSPSYLSIGSDDSSAMEVYYSAEEDNGESEDEELYTMDEGEVHTVDGLKRVDWLREEFLQQAKDSGGCMSSRDERICRGVIVQKTVKEEKNQDNDIQSEVQLQPSQSSEGQWQENRKFVVGIDEGIRSSVEFPHLKEEGKQKRKVEFLALPVQQVNTVMVCDLVLPSSEKHVPQDGSQENAGRYASSNSATSAATHTAGVMFVKGHTTHSAELHAGASEAEHNRTSHSTEWVDTITQSADMIRTVQQETPVNLTDTRHPGVSATQSGSRGVPTGARPYPIHGSMTASGAAVSQVFASENQLNNADWADNMNSGYSSLSTKLTFKNSSLLKETDSKRLHKVSLISEVNNTEANKTDASATSRAGTDLNRGDYKWKNRFEGVSQYKPPRFDDSGYRMPESHETTASKYFGTASCISSPTLEEYITPGDRLTDSKEVHLKGDFEQRDEWKGSSLEQVEPAALAAQTEREGELLRLKSNIECSLLPNTLKEEDTDSSHFSGVFQATLVELDSDPAAPPTTPPSSPDTDSLNQFDMDNLVDTLKSMGPSIRPRTTGPRPPAPVLISSLPPIVEDASSPASADIPDLTSTACTKEGMDSKPTESLNGLYTLPPDLGLRSFRDTRSPLELMKQTQQDKQQPGTQGLNTPLRVGRISSDSAEDIKSQMPDENGMFQTSVTGSRLDNSVIFGGHRSVDQILENRQAHRSLFRTSSLPEKGLSNDHINKGGRELESGPGRDQPGLHYDRFSVRLNTSTSGSLSGIEDPTTRISCSPQSGIGSPTSSNSPTRLLSPTGSIDLHRPFASSDSPLTMFGQTQGIGMGIGTGRVSTPVLQRSFSGEGTKGVQQTSLTNTVYGGAQFQSQEPEHERNLTMKYRAFPDAYLTKEKEHGKLNPRPGKMYIFDRPGMCGQRFEIRSDVIDATPWNLEETISIRVVRGGWVLYEKPNFKGEKIALDEGDIEITCPFNLPAEQLQNGHEDGKEQNGEKSSVQTSEPARKFIIGSIRRAVRDYSVPEICLFPEENAEGKKVIFRDTSEDARIFGFPIKANSVIINAGLWLVYAHPFFQGIPRVLEVGGYTNPAAWGVDKPYVGSLHPLKIGEPRVENTSEPKMVIYEKSYFSGKSRTITSNMRNFMTRTDRQQTTFMYSVGSLKVLGGIWVGYEKEGFRGHQYLLEEGEYHDWRVWGGCDSELRSVRVIRADLTDPLIVMFELPEEEQEGVQEENTFEVTEAIPDVELFGFKTNTRSIHVLSGAWIAYSHVDFSGNQYILEKGFYNNCADWGSQDNRVCSLQPILMAHGNRTVNEVIMYSEPDFQGECQVFDCNQEEVSEKTVTKSCRVSGGSWVFYEEKDYLGTLYVLSEGDYPNLSSMGCPSSFTIRSIKAVPITFSVPSISLFSLECLEGREITTETEIINMVEEGFNNHILSVRVNSGCWVICEHSNYRGRQFLLDPIEITNWLKFSSLETVSSLFPVRQKRRFFRIKNKELGHFMSVQGGVEEMKSGRVVVSPQVEPMSDIWFYQDGFIKNKLSLTMSLQAMGNIEPATKVVLWSETRQPIQTWTSQMNGLITSITFPGMVLDVKGGKTYDKDHVVIMPENEESPSQQWQIELL